MVAVGLGKLVGRNILVMGRGEYGMVRELRARVGEKTQGGFSVELAGLMEW